MKSFLMMGLLALSSTVFAGGVVGNGGGTAEQNILFAYKNLASYTRMCLESNLCELDAAEKIKLEKIHYVIPAELQTPSQIEFGSEKATPGFFVIDGTVRVAKTGSNVGDKIYVNKDLIYTLNSQNTYVAMDIAAATAMLLHEVAHHVGFSNDLVAVDLIGAKVRTHLMNQFRMATWDGGFRGGLIKVISILNADHHNGGVNGFSQLVVSDHLRMFDLSSLLMGVLPKKCRGSSPSGIPDPVTATDFVNLYFEGTWYEMGVKFLFLRGQLNIYCNWENGMGGSADRRDIQVRVPLLTNEETGFADYLNPDMSRASARVIRHKN